MDEAEAEAAAAAAAEAERVPHPHSPKLGVSGLSTILVASIQEAKDRISQIEYVFCSQLYPDFQSKRRRIEQLERHAQRCENEKALLSARLHHLEDQLHAEKATRTRLTQAYKSLKSQHLYLRRKFGLAEDNLPHQNRSQSRTEFATHQTPIVQPDLAFEIPNMTMGACEAAEVGNEITEEEFGGLEKKVPDVFVSAHGINEVKEKAPEDDRGVNLSSSSGFRDVPKCPSSTKLVPVSTTKRPASSWRQTRSHQSRVGSDPHDDFLDTPLENIRGNLNKDLNKEDLIPLVQKDISLDDSDDEMQDVNAKSSPQKKQKQSSIADDETEDMNVKSSPQKKQKQSSIADDETEDMNVKSSPQKKQKQSSITVTNKRNLKYVEPVRKKAERENLKGVECKQCKKFYDAVLPNADGKDADSSKQNFRCEHLDGASRHRYRYAPPMTPEGFWNIGFESEI